MSRRVWTLRQMVVSGGLMFAAVQATYPCSRVTDIPMPQILIGRADRIIVGHVSPQSKLTEIGDKNAGVKFECVSVIRGSPCDPVENSITLRDGMVTAVEELNVNASVPRLYARHSADASCFARGYKRGGMYLLLLKKQGDDYTPYWEPLAPTNEQVGGLDDPWVRWVESQVQIQAKQWDQMQLEIQAKPQAKKKPNQLPEQINARHQR